MLKEVKDLLRNPFLTIVVLGSAYICVDFFTGLSLITPKTQATVVQIDLLQGIGFLVAWTAIIVTFARLYTNSLRDRDKTNQLIEQVMSSQIQTNKVAREAIDIGQEVLEKMGSAEHLPLADAENIRED